MSEFSTDIDSLIAELDSMSQNPADDEANRRFADQHAGHTARLLEELKGWREQDERRQTGGGRIIVEGYDEDSMQGAFADALNKAAGFFSENHDVSVTVIGIVSLPHGGHRATLEVDIIPFAHKLIRHPDALDVENKRTHGREFAKFRHYEDEHLKALVHDHFLETTGGEGLSVPDYFLINFKDADLLNHMIEKEFFKAGHKGRNGPEPPQATVRVVKPEPEE